MPGSANLNIMMKAARKAGRSLVKDFREVENLQVSMKGAGDFVSRADLRAEEILKEELMTARPSYGWLAEEGGGEDGKDPTRRWIVDPRGSMVYHVGVYTFSVPCMTRGAPGLSLTGLSQRHSRRQQPRSGPRQPQRRSSRRTRAVRLELPRCAR